MRAARTTRCGLLTAGLLVSVVGSLSAQTAVDWPSERPPSPLPAQEIQFPPYHLADVVERVADRRGAAT